MICTIKVLFFYIVLEIPGVFVYILGVFGWLGRDNARIAFAMRLSWVYLDGESRVG